MSRWNHVEQAPPDPILGVAEAWKADPVRFCLYQSRFPRSVPLPPCSRLFAAVSCPEEGNYH